MKKGFVALLMVLALVVLVSPGIIGRLAEQSVDENLDWAANQNGELAVTSTGFDRGWFTSAGQHRVELLKHGFYTMLLGSYKDMNTGSLPVLIIDTRLDHGLIAVSSMARENGSLMPGLGNAVSTMKVEFADGSTVPVPGTLYSKVGLSGELESRYLLESEGVDVDNTRIDWGPTDFLLTASPGSGSVSMTGAMGSLAIESVEETLIIGRLEVDFDLRDSGYGFMIGPARISLDSVAVVGTGDTMTAGPLFLESAAALDGDRLNADVSMRIENTPTPLGGSGGITMVMHVENVDAAALGILKRDLETLRNAAYDPTVSPGSIDLQADLLRLFASGMKLNFDQLDINSPLGDITSRISASMSRSGDDDYTWASAALALDATADISVPVMLVDMATQSNPELLTAIGMGFLRKQGEFYTMKAAFKQGLLTVNGAPMPIPLTGLQ